MAGSGRRGRAGLASVVALAASTACSNSYRVDEGSGRSMILDADKRVVLTKKRHDGSTVVCAEPNPDLGRATNVEADMAAGAAVPAAMVAGVPLSGSVEGHAAAKLKTLQSLMAIGTRTAGVNVLRDYAYRACEAYLNNAIDAREYDLILLGSGYTIAAVMALDGMRDIDQPETPVEMGKIVAELAKLARDKMGVMDDGNRRAALP